jgi:hypothetical protein
MILFMIMAIDVVGHIKLVITLMEQESMLPQQP